MPRSSLSAFDPERLEAWYHPPLHEWPPTGGSHGKLHWTTKILSHASRRRGSSGRAHSSRRCRPSARWLLAISARKNSGGSFGKDYAISGISRARTFDLSFGPQKDKSTDFPNWPLSWFVSKSMSSSLGSRPPLWR